MTTEQELGQAQPSPNGAYASYDGRLRFYWPDDLYIIGSEAALAHLRHALTQAIETGRGIGQALDSDEVGRQVIVLAVEPSPDARSGELTGKPKHVPFVTLFARAGDEASPS